ncbi:hypothetical protein VCHA53O463_110136 [Vibrio chagasii]|nr:hypothetical protein VCHA35P150_20416 [Vibrio chagasii]CAH6904380.1 hypothetical protein VCHA56P515_100025 [Vibrio chagasii]CAH6971317.1 hypothetical protein VCHA53O463_110136 [Vibrio chagasii]CAH7050210.1 hypothetical protein VCHA36P166_50189 [Vibrio chagasii]CAH7388287.1 hypothetical protein VCHA53O464_20051 [Vibrio chagasii]
MAIKAASIHNSITGDYMSTDNYRNILELNQGVIQLEFISTRGAHE